MLQTDKNGRQTAAALYRVCELPVGAPKKERLGRVVQKTYVKERVWSVAYMPTKRNITREIKIKNKEKQKR